MSAQMRFRPAMILICAIVLGGVFTTSCKQTGGTAPSQNLTSNTPRPVRSPSKAPVIPAPELTTLAPDPIESAPPSPPSQPTRVPPSKPAAATKAANDAADPSPQVVSLALPPKPPRTLPRVPIRVAIAQQSPYLVIGASTSATVIDQQGQRVANLMASSAENFVMQGGQLQIGSTKAPNVVWVKPEPEVGLIYVSGRWYRGAVQVVASNGKLLGINHTDMESYLYSVVGSEMPASWPIEALKSQAIAARSYALAHIARPFNPLYDLGDTPRWQAYKGVETETNSTLVAVEETAGIVLSHNGAVVESLYAASENIVQDVHKGFGMSQNGANQLARKQYSFQQILAHFYPGTQLAWLQFSS